MTLTEFLTARLDEDEATVQQASRGPWRYPYRGFPGVVGGPHGCLWMSGAHGKGQINHEPDAVHIARHDPARVLREVEAKRRIVGLHGDSTPTCAPGFSDDVLHQDRSGPCVTLRALASVYADHPDYREEWRP